MEIVDKKIIYFKSVTNIPHFVRKLTIQKS